MNYERPPGIVIESISAVTLFTADMARAVGFYQNLGFRRLYGGPDADFTSFQAGEGYLNLALNQATAGWNHWGRIIFHVADVDAMYHRALEMELQPEAAPRDAPWGERFFHLRDPDGHELSFARPLARS